MFSGLFIIAVGLFYGASPILIDESFGINLEPDSLHIYRAIMGLYCAMGVLVLAGAVKTAHASYSLLLEAVFFGGIGAGRVVSFVMDGVINEVAISATIVEVLLCVISLLVLRHCVTISP